MQLFQNIWDWIKSNMPILFLFLFLAIWMYISVNTLQTASSNRKDTVACETLCFPQQSEYITKGESSSCWCYLDNNTIKRSQQ